VRDARRQSNVDTVVVQNDEASPARMIVDIEVNSRAVSVAGAAPLTVRQRVRRYNEPSTVHVTVVVRPPRVLAPYTYIQLLFAT